MHVLLPTTATSLTDQLPFETMATAREIEVLNTVNRVNRAQQIEDERLLATKKEAENARAEKQALHKHIGAADQKTDDLDSQIQLKEEHLAGLNATIVTMEQKKVEVEVEVEAEASAAIVAPAYIIHTHIHYFRNGPPPQAQPAAQKARRARQSS